MQRIIYSKLSLTFLLAFFLQGANLLHAQYIGDLTLSTQAQVDAFSYSDITGNLTITGADIDDLSPLSTLNTVGGDLEISQNPSLINLDGFPNLFSVDGNLKILNNSALESLDGFTAITVVGGDLEINGNAELISLAGFTNIFLIGGDLKIILLLKLDFLTGFSNLSSVDENLEILNNFELLSLDGLSSISSVGGKLEINGNSKLMNLNGLSSIGSVGGNLIIESNDDLSGLNGLTSLASVGGGLRLKNNAGISNMDGLSSLGSVGNFLTIENNSALSNLDSLSSLTQVGGNLNILSNGSLTGFCGLFPLLNGGGLTGTYNVSGNAQNPTQNQIINDGPCPNFAPGNVTLSTQAEVDAFVYTGVTGSLTISGGDISDLSPLQYLTSVGNSLIIINNPSLTSLDGFPALSSVGQDLQISNNLNLISLDGFPALASVAQNLQITGNLNLTSLDGFQSLGTVGGDINIVNNQLLNSLTGLSALTSVSGSLIIQELNALTFLDGFSSLTSVGGNLEINSNGNLSNLGGLSSLTSVDGNFTIQFNNALPNLNGLFSLASIGGNFIIDSNENISSLFGLFSLESIGGNFETGGNENLNSLYGLFSLETVGGDLGIGFNTTLTEYCGLFPLLNGGGLSGSYTVSNNAENPTQQEIIDGGPCPNPCPGDVTLSSQAEVNAFECAEVSGNLTISGADITNLSPLAFLSSVGGNLRIRYNDALTNLDGLSSLASVNGNLVIFDNENLSNLDGLSSLTSVGGNLEVSSNNVLSNLDGLSSLNLVGGNLGFNDNTDLTNINGLSSLNSVGGDLSILSNPSLSNLNGLSSLNSLGGNLSIQLNESLSNLNGLSSLNSVNGNLIIFDNSDLSNISGLSSLTSVGGRLEIVSSIGLSNLNGLSSLTSVGGNLEISSNGYLSNLDGLSSLNSVGGKLVIDENADLTNINGLSSLTSVGGNLLIRDNNALTDLDGLSSLTSVGGNLLIRDNNALTDLNGLSSLTSVGGNLVIRFNTNLNDLDGLSSLSSVGGNLEIMLNGNLSNLDGLSSLNSVGGSLVIDQNDVLTNINGLSTLTSFGGNLIIFGNINLTNLDGLSSLNSVGGLFSISFNEALSSLGGLSSLTSVGGNLVINNNGSLTSLDGLSSLTLVNGNVRIDYNENLSSLNGLNSLTSIGGDLIIYYNDGFSSIQGFSSLELIGGSLEISDNIYLTEIDGFSSLVSIGETLLIEYCIMLENLNGFTSLNSVGGSLEIDYTDLTNINGLSSLNSVGGDLSILQNESLSNLVGLSSLNSLGGNLVIEDNDITDINGLSSLTSVGGNLEITENDNLTEYCGLFPLLNGSGLSGSYTVSNNAENPTQLEIIDAGPCVGCPVNNILYVNDDANGFNNGTTWADAYNSLQDALTFFNSGACPDVTQIWVAAGTYHPDEGDGFTLGNRFHAFVMQNNLAIYGGFAGNEDPLTFDLADRDLVNNVSVLSGDIGTPDDNSDNSYQVVANNHRGAGNSAILDGFTITGGNANGTAPYDRGGGMFCKWDNPSIVNCVFVENSASNSGGAMHLTISSLDDDMIITNCSFAENSAGGSGGGIYITDNDAIITNCSFSGNSAGGSGGGIYKVEGDVEIINSNFLGNSAGGSGGGFGAYDAVLVAITNCTFSGNLAANNGGGIYNDDSFVFIRNTVVWNNKDNSGTGTANASFFNINSSPIFAGCLFQGQNLPGGGNLDGTDPANDPLFITPADPANAPTITGDLHLQSCSPAINVGANGANPTSTDLDGNPRFYNNGTIDLGAYEYQGAPFTGSVVYVNDDASGNNDGSSWADAFTYLHDALALANSCSNVTEIWVAAGTYYPDEGEGYTDNDRSHSFVMQNNLAIYGGFAGTEDPLTFDLADRDLVNNVSVLSGDIGTPDDNSDNSYQIVANDDNELNNSAILDGFTITGGNADGNNPNKRGGGMYNVLVEPTIRNCIFSGNSADDSGGGLYLDGGKETIVNCIVSGNSAANDGGGLYIVDSEAIIINCSFSGNAAANDGGGMYNNSSSPEIENTIIWNNKDQSGTGTANASIFNSSSSPSVIYSLVQGQNPGGVGNLDGTDASNDPLFIAGINPNLAPTTYGNLHLQPCSPVINAGNNNSVPAGITTDLDGNPRIYNNVTVEMGAYEYQGTPVAGSIIYVNDNASGNNDGSSWTDAITNLQDALSLATLCSDVSEIWVAAGTYHPDEGDDYTLGNRLHAFVLQNNLAVYGGFDGTEDPQTFDLANRDFVNNVSVLSGDIGTSGDNSDNSYQVVANNNRGAGNSAILDGFTITGGNANGTDPYDRGGGMFCKWDGPSIVNCVFVENSASNSGGAMYLTPSSYLSDDIIITNCSFAENSAGGSGGGIYKNGDDAIITNCNFSGNSAGGSGGGIYTDDGLVEIINCNFLGNSAGGSGGGFSAYDAPFIEIINCTFSGNLAANNGGGIYNDDSFVILKNTVVWNNKDISGTGTANASFFNINSPLLIVSCLLQGQYLSGGNNLDGTDPANDPLFITPVDPANAPTITGDLHLQSCSPVINIGLNNQNPTSTDLDGNPRFYNNGTIDLGAYEYQGAFAPCCPDGEVIFVDANASGLGNGESWDDAFNYLQDALALATACSDVTQIWVASGSYYPDEGEGYSDNVRTHSFVMQNNLAIYGGFVGTEDPLTFDLADRDFVANETILSGDIGTPDDNSDNSYHVFFHDNNGLNNSAILDGFTITGGNANGVNHPHYFGGGMYNSYSSPKVANCSFTENAANSNGGGISNRNESSPTVINCSFSENSASSGGGIYHGYYSNTTLTNCSFSGNSANTGGGIYNSVSLNIIVTNCCFYGNSASDGGGIYNFDSNTTLTNCSFSGNSANNGGGIYNNYSIPTVTNCIFWGNGSEIAGPVTPVVSYSIVEGGYSGTGNQNEDPLFVDPVNGDLRLQSCSPAINAGANTAVPAGITTDLDGNPRFYDNGIVDMGAYEFQGNFAPCCPEPSDLMASAITATTADLGWTENGVATSWQIRLGLFGFDTTGATPVVTASNPYPATGLDPDTGYDFYVRAVCDGSGFSDWVGPYTFTTGCASPTAVCQNITVYLDATGNATITAADIDGGSTAPCGLLSLDASQTSFSCNDVGPNDVTLTITDVNSDSDNCVAIVTVADTITPNPGTIAGNTGITYGSSTGDLVLSGNYGDVKKWQKRFGTSGIWTDIAHTGTIYSEIPASLGVWQYRVLVQGSACVEAFTDPHSVIVGTKELTISGTFTANDKIYDDNTDATFDQNNLNLVGVVGSEDVSLTGLEIDFESKEVGNHTVSITSAELTGADKNNYTLSLDGSPTTTANIDPGPPAKFLVTGPDGNDISSPKLHNIPFDVKATLVDAFDNPTPNMGGDVELTLTGSGGATPGDLRFQGFPSDPVTQTLGADESSIDFNNILYTGVSSIAGFDVKIAAFASGTGSANGKTGESNLFSVRGIFFTVEADPTTLPADGASKSDITVTLLDYQNNPLADQEITLETDFGTLMEGTTELTGEVTRTTDANGQVMLQLRAGDESAIATVTAKCPGACPQSVEVAFTLNAPEIAGFTPGQNEAIVEFNPPTNPGLTSISNYEYSLNDGTDWATFNPAQDVSPVTITGLTEYQTYPLKLRAINEAGIGAASESFEIYPCANPTDGGEIEADQTICYETTPAEISNVTLPSGEYGTLEYKWQHSVVGASSGFEDIDNSDTENYQPDALNETTWFRRLARVMCDNDWNDAASSNAVKITVQEEPVADAGSDATIPEGEKYLLTGSSASEYSSLLWTGNGDGSFNANHILHPEYTPGSDDLLSGSVELCLTAAPVNPCTVESTDCMQLIINAPPEIAISTPLQGESFYKNPVEVSGTASDINNNIDNVELRLNGGSWLMANGSENWWTTLSLVQGNNLIEVRAKDSEGLYSDIASVDVTFNLQVIDIPQGWSYISSFLDPLDPSPENMFADLVGANNLVLLSGTQGFYAPGYYINTLGNWDVTKGYKVLMNAADELMVNGDTVTDKTITFQPGTQLIPVLTNVPVDINNLFNDPQNVILYMFDIHTNEIFWPQGGIFTLQQLKPGKGYLVNFDQEVEVSFPPMSDFTIPDYKSASPLPGPWPVARTGDVHLISVSMDAVRDLNNADYLGAFSQNGNCVGFAAISGMENNVLLTTYGDDPNTSSKDGAAQSEPLSFVTWSYADGEATVEASFSDEFPNHDGLFAINGLSMITGFSESATTITETSFSRHINVYPVPANDQINIVYPVKEEKIDVKLISLSGEVLENRILRNEHTRWDVSGLAPDVYILRFSSEKAVDFKRIVIK